MLNFKCGLLTNNISIIWVLVQNRESEAPDILNENLHFKRSRCDVWEALFYIIYWFLLLLCQVLRESVLKSLWWYICLHFLFNFICFDTCIFTLSQVHTSFKLLYIPGRLASFIIMNWLSLTLWNTFALNSVEILTSFLLIFVWQIFLVP